MNDLVNPLQTLALVAVLVLTFAGLGWIVYAFTRFAAAFNKMIQTMEKTAEHTVTISTGQEEQAPEPPPNRDIREDVPVELKRYQCHRCHAKLPESPTHSIIKEAVTFLVFKCRRCGKETEVNPEASESK